MVRVRVRVRVSVRVGVRVSVRVRVRASTSRFDSYTALIFSTSSVASFPSYRYGLGLR